jgi:hypothetical protein
LGAFGARVGVEAGAGAQDKDQTEDKNGDQGDRGCQDKIGVARW